MAEILCVMLGQRRTRKYVLYVSGTQGQADDHLETIGTMLEGATIEKYDPLLSSRKMGKYGSVKGWRGNRLRTACGFTIDSLGLDVAKRGVKLEDMRPDFMVFDDIDDIHDTARTTKKKINTITKSILPTRSANMTSLWVQNLIIPNGIFAQLSDGRAEFILDRVVSGPVPALLNFSYEMRFDTGLNRNVYKILTGEPTWEGQSLAICEDYINTYGPDAFLRECQHEVTNLSGGMFDNVEFRRIAREDAPEMRIVTVCVDPAVSAGDDSSNQGIQVDGIGSDGQMYRLHSWEAQVEPEEAIRYAIELAVYYKAGEVCFETNQGGNLWQSNYNSAWKILEDEELSRGIRSEARLYKNKPTFVSERATASLGSKEERWLQMKTDYAFGKIIHIIGTHEILESSLKRLPDYEPFDLADAAFWGWYRLNKRRHQSSWADADPYKGAKHGRKR